MELRSKARCIGDVSHSFNFSPFYFFNFRSYGVKVLSQMHR